MKSIQSVLWGFLLLYVTTGISAQERLQNPYEFNEVTLYVIPSVVEFDWTSPSTLLDSYVKGYAFKPFSANKYVLGHMFVGLTSPRLEKPYYTGIINSSGSELRKLVLKDKIGLGILGADVAGELEDREDVAETIRDYARKGKIASLVYRIGDQAFDRILDFLDYFSGEDDHGFIPSGSYGGAFWPLHHYEGAGCTALALSMLEIIGRKDLILDEWAVNVKIPMELIGGSLNDGRKVNLKDIRKYDRWFEGEGAANEDYVAFSIYETNFIYRWIIERFNGSKDLDYKPYMNVSGSLVPALFTDLRDQGEIIRPLLHPREDNNFFIRHFMGEKGLSNRDFPSQ
ncbi:hypothetical protein BA6E_12143 [Bacteroidales bacterium 6E]|nr:hypothetical protein BA6E_12143 [Bacteroidales bacterium 6E]